MSEGSLFKCGSELSIHEFIAILSFQDVEFFPGIIHCIAKSENIFIGVPGNYIWKKTGKTDKVKGVIGNINYRIHTR